MRKIPTIFERDPDNRSRVTDVVSPGCLWVFNSEGVATRKWDGTCCLVESGQLFKRYEVKKGQKVIPGDFMPATGVDPNTGKIQGWVPVGGGPEDKWHREAFDAAKAIEVRDSLPDGTYELLGPKVQGNPERFDSHVLVSHDRAPQFPDAPHVGRAELVEWLRDKDIEGIVWHHPDGRMAKIKKRDLGISRGTRREEG